MLKPKFRILLTAAILFASLASAVGIGYAQGGGITPTIEVVNCGDVQFSFTVTGVTEPYSLILSLGNGDSIPMEDGIASIYSYIAHGDYAWEVQVLADDDDELLGSYSGILTLEGPEVTLSSSPFPPLFVVGDTGEVIFSTDVIGGTSPFIYTWDLGGDLPVVDPDGKGATSAYTAAGKYYPEVMVTDSCKFTTSDTMPVVVANPEDACHPMAQKISDGVNTIFPNQSNDLYTCEDIYALFDNESEENNLGFGRMWKAYHLAESMEELTWEDILDWHLNESGWGSLLQLDRFADLLEDHDLPELMGLVMSEDFSLGDVRLAVRSVTRFEAELEDALTRISEGAKSGELGQFYKLAADLEADVEVLDGYLADGLTLSELKHTAKFAERMEVDWTEIANSRSEVDSWGDLGQAYRLAAKEEVPVAEILEDGVQAYKESLRDQDKVARELIREEGKAAREEKQTSRTEETAQKLAEQFPPADEEYIMSLFNGDCEGNWGCVRKALRNQEQETAEGESNRDAQTALQIGSKYGFDEEAVLKYHKDECGEDWACTRTYFRKQYMETKETGKPNKK